jgi:hypothetical protein
VACAVPLRTACALGQVEVIQLIEPRVDFGLCPHVAHRRQRFAVAAQRSGQHTVKGRVMVAQPIAQPARLLVAEVRQPVVAMFVLGCRIGLPVTHQNQFAHRSVPFGLGVLRA